ncbi:RNA polymerase sigma factor RpoE [Olavius sp. associated proteobacterium Delta 1]|nr:RNA polymerase sigma factor RpoE [Olavius sp. associated proteobacterium Delta 1]
MESDIEKQVELAVIGEREALENLVRCIQDHVYKLALRMLAHPEDAEDAAQEILIKVITHLSSFRKESKFMTWVYRISANHLLTTRKRRVELREANFEKCQRQIDKGFADTWHPSVSEAMQKLIVEELRIDCLQTLLQCLDRNLRIAYTLGEVFEVNSVEGAYILEISPLAFRKRLSRARKLMRKFMLKNCGLINLENLCYCERLAPCAVKTGWINPEKLVFANHKRKHQIDDFDTSYLQELDEISRVAALFRSHPDYAAPETFIGNIKQLLDSGRFKLLQ